MERGQRIGLRGGSGQRVGASIDSLAAAAQVVQAAEAARGDWEEALGPAWGYSWGYHDRSFTSRPVVFFSDQAVYHAGNRIDANEVRSDRPDQGNAAVVGSAAAAGGLGHHLTDCVCEFPGRAELGFRPASELFRDRTTRGAYIRSNPERYGAADGFEEQASIVQNAIRSPGQAQGVYRVAEVEPAEGYGFYVVVPKPPPGYIGCINYELLNADFEVIDLTSDEDLGDSGDDENDVADAAVAA